MRFQFELKSPGCKMIRIPVVFIWANQSSGIWNLVKTEFENLIAWDRRGSFKLDRYGGTTVMDCFDILSRTGRDVRKGDNPGSRNKSGLRFTIDNSPAHPRDKSKRLGVLDINDSRNPAGWTTRREYAACPPKMKATWRLL